MKILHVITSLRIGGAEKLITEIVPLLINRGHDVSILLFDGSNTFFLEKLYSVGIKIQYLSLGGNVYNPILIRKIIPFLLKYDIIHTHNTACQYFVVLACAFLRRRPKLVTTEHNTSNRRRNLFLFRYLDIWMYNHYDKIISISDKTTENLLSYLKTTKYIYTINNGINTSVYAEAEPSIPNCISEISKDSFIVTMVAGFRDQKDQDSLIRALSLLPKDYVLWLIGDGKRKQTCQLLAKELGVFDRVFFLGIRDDVPSLLRRSDVVVMSSHWEGFGLAAVEGMAAGKPVIASNVAGLAEVVNGAGLLFEPGNSRQLADIIQKLRTDTFYNNEIVAQCIERAQLYDIDKMVDSYLQIYNSLSCEN